MSAKSKITLLMDLSDKLFNGKLDKMTSKFDKKIDKLGEKLGMENATQKLQKGIKVAAVAGMAALSTLSYKGVQAAERFDSAFLPIRQLNLDKSKDELDSFREGIRTASYEIGTNLEASTNAVYDLQSATGLYGDDAIDVFKKVGRYSVATGANINDAMNSTTKAMKAFGLEIDQIDSLLESNAKTVQTGITTFDELAKVQTEYAGAASAAGQGIDEANKVFAMFTSIAKNSDVGANMAKTFFQGLGQQADKFEDVLSVPVFDENGSMRQADSILKDVAKRFESMSQKEITQAINKIGGPEGLRGALAKVSTGAEDMLATFDAFDASQFSLENALANAEGDFGKMKEIFFNRIDIVLSKFGEKIIPMLAKLFDTLTPVLGFINDNLDWLLPVFGTFIGLLGAAAAAMWVLNSAMFANPIVWIIASVGGLIALIAVAINKFDQWGAGILALMGPLGWLIITIKKLGEHWDSIVEAFKSDGILGAFKQIGFVLLDAIQTPLEQIMGWIASFDMAPDFIKDAHKKIVAMGNVLDKKFGKDKNQQESQEEESLLDKATENKNGSPVKPNNLENTISGVNKSATSAKSINIKIDALMKGDVNVNEGNGKQMNFNEFENLFNEMMMRIARNAELS
ncbi:phage tail tape measure protein [Psychroflexus sp. ALD_RP9]|uniref:phage tail tape measure protein n=1 Tax=Psychroflexus sp. ALD_RP9 TaxID=2777186 RepID=UPI001A8C3ED8|nr:phage tail tape measure protein [Psychroflexus sp. ALD_RP9]QSS96597.1 phage tail tape measure protein [Psychroflexus sp. ALD_RP9]